MPEYVAMSGQLSGCGLSQQRVLISVWVDIRSTYNGPCLMNLVGNLALTIIVLAVEILPKHCTGA